MHIRTCTTFVALAAPLAVALATAPWTQGGLQAQSAPPRAAPLGPLTSEEGAPLQRLGHTPAVEGALPTAPGSLRADLWVGYGSVWEQDSTAVADLFLDLERVITTLTVRAGLAEGLEAGARATLERTGGGFLDGAVMGFHRFVGAGDRNRPDYPRNAYGQWLRDADGTLLVDVPDRTAPTLEDVRLFAKGRLAGSDDGRRSLAARVEVRVPTAANTVGEERADVALLLTGHTPWRGWFLHALAGATTVRRSPELEGVLRTRQWTGMVGAERPLRDGLSLVAQLTGSTPLLRSFGDHDVDGAPTNVVFGIVGRTRGGWRWEAAMQEDVPARGPSNDFTLQISLGRTW